MHTILASRRARRRPATREAMLAFLMAFPAAWVLGELAVLLAS